MKSRQKSDRHGTVHHSFRIDEILFFELEKEAEKKGMSVSSLMLQILAKYCTCDRYFEGLGFVPLSKDIMRQLLSKIDDRSLIECGNQLGSTVARAYVSYFFHDVNKHTLLEFLDVWFSRFQSYEHKISGTTHSFVLNHDINIQCSIFLKGFMKALIEPIVSKAVNITESTPNLLRFSFEI